MNENHGRSKTKMQISGSQGISQINMFSGITLEATAALESFSGPLLTRLQDFRLKRRNLSKYADQNWPLLFSCAPLVLIVLCVLLRELR